MQDQINATLDREATTVMFPATPPYAELPQVSVLQALRRYPMLVLLPLVLLAAAGVTYGMKRPPMYTASSEINVGVPNSDSEATPGYALAAEQLASSYSREATSQVVAGRAGRALGLSASETAQRLSSSAVPNSPTFYVNATGPTQSDAIRLANGASDVLRTAVNSGLQSQSAGVLLVRYSQLQSEANTLSSLAGKLQSKYNLQPSSSLTATSPVTPDATTTTTSATTTITAAQVSAAKLRAQTAQLKAETAAQRYTTASAGGPSANLVVLFSARTATDDRMTVTERFGIVGAFAGLVIGIALAFMLARWRERRLGLSL
jgi:capsular polysaccharide biosynthesis protein